MLLAKTRGQKLTIGHGGNGTLMHLTAEMLNQMAGINLALVAYRGMAPVVTDLIGGHVSRWESSIRRLGCPPLKRGTIKPLAVTSLEANRRDCLRFSTVAELGVPGFEFPTAHSALSRPPVRRPG